jgi:PPOX class probable FMN-dependent enzyme
MPIIDSLEALEACYAAPAVAASVVKELDHLTPHYRDLIEASPFVVLATCGPDGLDNAPCGGGPGFVRIVDDRTLVLPDRRGADRLDSLRNILFDPRVALLFLIPNAGTTLRVNGRAAISADPELLASFGTRDAPTTALIITVETVYFQSPRSVIKAGLWNPVTWGNPDHLPSQADMLEALSEVKARERELVSV